MGQESNKIVEPHILNRTYAYFLEKSNAPALLIRETLLLPLA